MTEKTRNARPRRQPQPGPRTELRMVVDGWRAFRTDLTRGAFAFQPISPLPTDTPWLTRVPGRIRGAARRLPRTLVLAAACFLLLWTAGLGRTTVGGLLQACVVATPVAMLVLRPIGAFWLSLGSLLLTPAGHGDGLDFPHGGPALAAHLTVLLFVAWRLPTRAAFPMWSLTALTCTLVDYGYSGIDPHTSKPAAVAFFYGVALLMLLVIRAWRDSRRQVVEQSAVVREERSLRTQLEERTVIARELHDVVAHHMSVVAIQAEAAPYRVPDPPEELVRALATIRENAVTALSELRRVLGVVRTDLPSAPEAPQPTLAELPALVANVQTSGREVEFVTTGGARALPPGVELSAYRIVQESLSNVLRHAPEAGVRVELAYVLGGLGLRVTNESPSGPAPQPTDGGGQGIRGMRERAALLGGELTAGERADGGWDVEAFLPVETSPVETSSAEASSAEASSVETSQDDQPLVTDGVSEVRG